MVIPKFEYATPRLCVYNFLSRVSNFDIPVYLLAGDRSVTYYVCYSEYEYLLNVCDLYTVSLLLVTAHLRNSDTTPPAAGSDIVVTSLNQLLSVLKQPIELVRESIAE